MCFVHVAKRACNRETGLQQFISFNFVSPKRKLSRVMFFTRLVNGIVAFV